MSEWTPDIYDEQNGLCTLNDSEKELRVYAKWDDMIHLWIYNDEYMFNCDSGEYGPETRKTTHCSYYWCIGGIEELNALIAKLQAIQPAVTKWYAERGKRWPVDWDAYVKGTKTLEEAQMLDKEQ